MWKSRPSHWSAIPTEERQMQPRKWDIVNMLDPFILFHIKDSSLHKLDGKWWYPTQSLAFQKTKVIRLSHFGKTLNPRVGLFLRIDCLNRWTWEPCAEYYMTVAQAPLRLGTLLSLILWEIITNMGQFVLWNSARVVGAPCPQLATWEMHVYTDPPPLPMPPCPPPPPTLM